MAILLRWMMALALLATSGAAMAQRKAALIIANSAYSSTSILSNPPNDARIVADSARRAGFETVMLANNLTLANFQRALRDFREKASGADVAMVYYAGHGIEGAGKNWLIPVDAKLGSDLDLPYEAIDLDRVLEAISGAQVRMVVLDACRNNPFGRSWSSKTRAVARGLAQMDVDDVLVIYAAAPGQTASDGDSGNSPFATSLAKRLSEPGLPLQLLGGSVRDDVLKSTGGSQRPFVSASITGTPVYLVEGKAAPFAQQPVAAPVAAATVDDATLDALAWQGALGANSEEAFREYRRQFPQGRFAKLAEQNIAKFGRPGGSNDLKQPPNPRPSLPRPTASNMPTPAPNARMAPALIFPDSSRRRLTRADVMPLSAAQLRIARNEIFARHGFNFASPDLRAYFSRFDWYMVSTEEIRLSELEMANVRLLQQAERVRGNAVKN